MAVSDSALPCLEILSNLLAVSGSDFTETETETPLLFLRSIFKSSGPGALIPEITIPRFIYSRHSPEIVGLRSRPSSTSLCRWISTSLVCMVSGILCTLDFNFIISFFLLTGTPTGVPIGKMFPEIGTTLLFLLLPLLLFSF